MLVEKVQGSANPQSLADIARHGLLGRCVPLYPVECPHVPQVRVIHRCIGHAVVVGGNRIAEAGIGDAPKSIGTARAFQGWIEAAVGIVPGHTQESVQRRFEVLAQLLVLRFILIAQHGTGEALEFPRVVVGRGEAGYQRLAKAAAAQGRHARWQYVLGRGAVNPHSLAFEAQFAGVAGGAGDIQIFHVAAGVLVAGKAHWQVARVGGTGLLLGVYQKAEARQVFGGGKRLFGKRQLKGAEPVVMQAFNLGALGGVVIGLAISRAPLIQVVQLLRGLVSRQFWIGDEIEHQA